MIPATSTKASTASHGFRLRPLQYALALLWLGTLPLAWAAPAANTPLAVSLLPGNGATVLLRVRTPAVEEPVLDWSGATAHGPYRLVLAWPDTSVTLDGALPALPDGGLGPLESLSLQNAPGRGRLELLLNQDVAPRLRRMGDTWELQLDPLGRPAPKAIPPSILASAPTPASLSAAPVQSRAGTKVSATPPTLSAAPLITPAPPSAPTPKAAAMVSPAALEPTSAVAATSPSAEAARPLPRARRAAQGGGKTGKDAAGNTAPFPEVLLVDVTINDQHLKDVVRAELVPGGPLLLPADAWTEARLVPLAQTTAMGDGTPAYPLDALTGATYRINRQTLSLVIIAPGTAFTGAVIGLQEHLDAPPPRPDPGMMLNYDVAASHSGGFTTGGAVLEAVAFSPLGNLVASGLVTDTGRERYATWLDTYWRYDLPQRMETLIVGDAVGVGGSWSRPVRFGGIRWGRDFALRPGFVTMPQISLAGEAALPSTVEVLVNNVRQSSRPVQPGPFDLTNVPITTGAGQIGLVVRDLLGRETVIQQSYYAAPHLLAPGLTDFSFEAGWLRTGYGRDSAYGDAFGAGTWRQGLSNSLTGDARVEVQVNRRAGGVALASLVGTWGVGHVALAASSGSSQGPSESGQLVQAGFERSTPTGGFTAQYEHASQGFAPFGESLGPLVAAQRAHDRWLVSTGGTLWGPVNGGISYVQQTRWDGDSVQWLGLSLSLPLWQGSTLNATVSKRLDGDQSWSAGVTLNFPLDNGVFTSAQATRGTDGKLSGTATAQRNAPSGPGLGWRVQAGTTESQRAQAGLVYNTNHAELGADIVASAGGQVAARAGARGTLGWVDNMLFASRPVGQNSVAVVEVEGIEGVPVMRANQVVAVTDSRGRAFVADLQPWLRNQIAIDPVDLPLDAQVASTTKEVTPYARTGVVVNFAAKRSRQALLVLHQADGTPVPIGTKVRLLPDGPEFLAGRRGEVWLTDLAEKAQPVEVRWPKGGCTLALDVPASTDGTPGKIGPLACEKGKL